MSYTRTIVRALETMFHVRDRLPPLADRYPPGSAKRIALEEAVTAVAAAYEEVFGGLNGRAGGTDGAPR